MIRHNFTLHKVTEALKALIGTEIFECYTQDKDSVVIGFFKGTKQLYLQIYTKSEYLSTFLKSNIKRAKKNTLDILPKIIGHTVIDVYQVENQRAICIKTDRRNIDIILFGGKLSNVVVSKSNNLTIDSFKRGIFPTGKNFKYPERFIAEEPVKATIGDYLNSTYFLGRDYLDELIARLEIIHKIKIAKSQIIGDLSDSILSVIETEAQALVDYCLSSEEFLVYNDPQKGYLLSLIPLAAYDQPIAKFSDINQAITFRIIEKIKTSSFSSEKKGIETKVRRVYKKLKSNIEQIKKSDALIDLALSYKNYGDLLASQPDPKSSPGTSIDLPDWSGETQKIKLDKKLNLIENSAKYYKKAKSTRENVDRRKELLPGFQKDFSILGRAKILLEDSRTLKDLKIIKELVKNVHGINFMEHRELPENKYRTFDLGEGLTLYAGKNAANNDELTMKFAKPNDMWFHARGSSGSHCVIRLEKGQRLPKYIMEKAASIAAYYSKAKNAKYTPVAYTYKKYIRKPKGANPGSVVISREQVIMAHPKLPEA